MELNEYLEKEILIFDGGMGTILQSMGLKSGELPETLNFKESEKIIEIHRGYIDAGAKVITTNTFGANEKKLEKSGFTVDEVIDKAVDNAKKASRIGENIFVALDIGPLGELLEPAGTLSFEGAYEAFKTQVLQGVKSGVDLILIETMTDLYEAKAAVLAAKENSSLPVFCTMSFEENGRTFMGSSVASMVMVLQGLGVDAIGINCSLGPKEIEPILDEVLKISKVPVMVQPNAGLPCLSHGEAVFKVSPKEFADYGKRFAEKGVRIIGGCCGTTFEHIKSLVNSIKNVKIQKNTPGLLCTVCTGTNTVTLDEIKVIGERINPTGKKLFKEALRKGDMDYIINEAIAEVEAGADILDVNVGLPEIDEAETMVRVIKEIQSVLPNTPLQIDSSNPIVIEKALRIYNGKAIVNSVNGENKVLDSILPIVKKYGALVVGLTLDEKGIPNSAEERFAIAEKIIARAKEYGIDKENILIDCLTLTAAAQQKEVRETIKAVSMVKKILTVKTVLGVSNVSFGLPERKILNRTFLAAALGAGLDLPIINPLDKDMMDTVKASKVLWSMDIGAALYIDCFKDAAQVTKDVKSDIKEDLFNVIIKGIKDEAKNATFKLLKGKGPLDIVNKDIIPALDYIGEKYEKGDIFLPQLIQSAETVKKAFEAIKEKIKEEPTLEISKDKIILATVKGDIHDIGKNIVKVLLENYGFEVIDLGKNVSMEKIIEETVKNNVKLIGLSALMTTTVKSMESTISALKELDRDCQIMVGGAVLNKEFADKIGADYYAKDAREAVNIARTVFSSIIE